MNSLLWTPLPTEGAVWMPPLDLPRHLEARYRERPVSPGWPPIVTGYQAVKDLREVPIPGQLRHNAFDELWGDSDGVERLSIGGGSTYQARQFTEAMVAELLEELMATSNPPWNLAQVIYPTSIFLMIGQTLQAPPLSESVWRLQELVRQHVTATGGLPVPHQPLVDEVLWRVVDRYDELPSEGLACHLVNRCRRDELTERQLLGILWALLVSSEVQATAAINALTILIASGHYDYVHDNFSSSEVRARIVAEMFRLAPVFPASTVRLNGVPHLISYAAANRDPAVFGDDADRFNPTVSRPPHLAFGGSHRCPGEVSVTQFVTDVLTAALEVLPRRIRLVDGVVRREVEGISWSVPEAFVEKWPE